jgi:hypothetical protein
MPKVSTYWSCSYSQVTSQLSGIDYCMKVLGIKSIETLKPHKTQHTDTLRKLFTLLQLLSDLY